MFPALPHPDPGALSPPIPGLACQVPLLRQTATLPYLYGTASSSLCHPSSLPPQSLIGCGQGPPRSSTPTPGENCGRGQGAATGGGGAPGGGCSSGGQDPRWERELGGDPGRWARPPAPRQVLPTRGFEKRFGGALARSLAVLG